MSPAERIRGARACVCSQHQGEALAHALPGLAATEHAAEGATLYSERIRSLHRYRRVVLAARVGIADRAGPFRVIRTHVDQDPLAGFHRKATQIGAALFDA